MTKEMRERVMQAIEMSKGSLTIDSCKETIEYKKRVIESSKSEKFSFMWESKYYIEMAQSDIEYFEAVIEVLTEMAEIKELEVINETVQEVIKTVSVLPRTKLIRKTVAAMANKFRKLGYSLSVAFKKAWKFIKTMFEPQASYKRVA